MRYLINKYGHDENEVYGFDSDLSFSELSAELNSKISTGEQTGKDFDFEFQGYTFSRFNPRFSGVELITLEMFWERSIPSIKQIF